MGHDEMKMEMIQCLTTFGVNETYDIVELEESDGKDPDGLIDLTDELKPGI
jgi:hypothetical protein